MKRRLALAAIIAISVAVGLAAITLLSVWRDGWWYGARDGQTIYMVRANALIVGVGSMAIIYLCRRLRR